MSDVGINCLFNSIWVSSLYMIPTSSRHVPVEPKYIPKIIHNMFEFLHVPFSLQKTTQSFQRFIDPLLYGLDFTCAYMDDVFIMHSFIEEHGQQV